MSDVTTAPRATPVGWPLLVVLASLAAVAPFATDLYLPGFPELAADLGSTASQTQLTLTAFMVGMAVGQLVTGPLSDRWGRRGPLLVSAATCVAAGVVTAVAPNLGVLVAARVVQGLAGAGGMVIGRAVISDLVSGRAAARAFTLMMTVGGVAPVVAPLAGALLLGPLGWRGLMWVVTGLCVLMLLGVVFVVHETHPPGARSGGCSFGPSLRRVLTCGPFWGPLAVSALAFGAMMAYISSSPFVYRNVVGLSEVGYGIAFGCNAIGLVTTGFVAARLVDHVAPRTVVRVSVAVQATAAVAFVVLAVSGAPSWTLPPAIFVAISANGGILGNASALAMSRVREVAGTGSAVLGFTQFLVGGAVSPLVGLAGDDTAVLPAVVMATCSLSALAVSRVALSRRVLEADPAPV